ncbi:MAG: rhamnogalacturonan lyase [Planctomycetia bacterium]|nr:rhamnogalacturonan lyase [Planctomycetia bacterium]
MFRRNREREKPRPIPVSLPAPSRLLVVGVGAFWFLCLNAWGAESQPPRAPNSPCRGAVAVACPQGVFLSWKCLPGDEKTTFEIHRDGNLVRVVSPSEATCFVDADGSLASRYEIRALREGDSGERFDVPRVWAQNYRVINLDLPEEETMPDGSRCFYTPGDISPGDLDGDGEYELVVKWEPSNAHDNSHAGYTGSVFLDAYRLNGEKLWRINLGRNIRAGAHYTQFLVYDFNGDGRAEVAFKTADGSRDGVGKILGDSQADWRNTQGKIAEGAEFLSIFDGRSGALLDSVEYLPPRTILPQTREGWGDNYANRQDRFLACVAYLDGASPSLVFCRGYYTSAFVSAYDFKDNRLIPRWFHASTTPDEGLYGEGFHTLAVGDVDDDGRDEIIYGSAALDDDGSLLYRTGLGHGDALHLADIDPTTPGLEVWSVHEEKEKIKRFGCVLRASDGRILWGLPARRDVGRGLAADIDPYQPGVEVWSAVDRRLYSARGEILSENRPDMINFRIYWDGDALEELLDGVLVSKWDGRQTHTIVNFGDFNHSHAINGTKATPNLQADLLGDWREEVIFYNAERPSELNLFTTTIPTALRRPTLMSERQYRTSVATQNVGYNQPPSPKRDFWENER